MLHIEKLSVTYTQANQHIPAVMDVSFSAKSGECIGIIGESGCGKSSLALALMGLIRGGTVTGTIHFRGHELTSMDEREHRKFRWQKIAMVFQNSLEIFNPVTTLGEQLIEVLTTHLGLSIQEATLKVRSMLLKTGLDPKWQNAYPHQLSGGMRQRGLIAMALCCEPDILIVDEPTTSLDPDNRREVLELLQELQKEFGFTMLLISHNLSAIQKLCTRVFTMYGGRIIEEGATEKVLSTPLHPYTRGLINSASDFFPFKDLWGIQGSPPQPGESTGCSFSPRCCQFSKGCNDSTPPLQTLANGRKVACHKNGIETVLQATAIKKRYQVGRETIQALKGVDLSIRRGEVVALVGKSGSGKSTLANIMVGVLQADSGLVQFCGKQVKKHENSGIMGGIQLVFQDPNEAVSHRLSVLDAVCEPLLIQGWGNRATRHTKAMESLAAMHLPTSKEFLLRPCHSLSGGQRQRLAIARSLTTDPVLLVADEITAMLDPSTQAVILRELKGRQHESGFSMLFITHNMDIARKIADSVYVLEQGSIIQEGACFSVLGAQLSHFQEKISLSQG